MKNKIIGIYLINNIINDKVYYGSSVDCERRWYQHKSSLNKNIHKNYHLQSSWNKYGKDTFIFNIVEKCSFDQLQIIEQKYLDISKQNVDKYYNIGKDAICWNRGLSLSNEHKSKLSISHIGYIMPESQKENIRNSQIGLHTGNKNQMFGKAAPNRDHTIYSFKNSITGESFVGMKTDFVKKYKLIYQNVWAIVKGNRQYHKGWKLCSY